MEVFCKILTNPSWWNVIFTAISTIAIIVIAIIQIKLQKRQTETQDFDTYRSLYSLITCSNEEITKFLPYIHDSISAHHETLDRECFMRKLNDIFELKNKLNQNILDYKLKFSKDFINIDKYLETLNLMSSILKYLHNIYQSELFLFNNEQIEISDDNSYIKAILTHINIKVITEYHKKYFHKFIKLKHEIQKDELILEEICKRCKIN